MNGFYLNLEGYRRYLAGSNLTPTTRKQYACQARLFVRWLSASGESVSVHDDGIEAIRRYERYLQEEQDIKPSTINFTLSALTDFFDFLGHSNLKLKRHPRATGKADVLNLAEQQRFVRVLLSDIAVRDRAIVLLMLVGGLRIGEVAMLDCSDLNVDAMPPYLEVRLKRSRRVPISRLLLEALLAWMSSEPRRISQNQALFLNRNDCRLSVPSLDQVIRKCGRTARLNLSAQLLRNTCISNLMQGLDTLLVAQITGADIEILRRFRNVSEVEVLGRMELSEAKMCETPGNRVATNVAGCH